MANEYHLKDLIQIKNGCDHKHLSDGIFPVYGSGGIMRYCADYLYDKPSILLPRKGSLTNIQFASSPFWTVDTIYYTEVDTLLANPYYLFRYLTLLDLSNLDSGTGVPSMTFDSYYNIKVKLPDINTQNLVAEVLQSIDRKIATNREINRNLEAMARQLYDYWFVQFDFPDENGKPYKSSGGKMVWNERLKRGIPEGWEIVNLFHGIDIQYGFPFSTELFSEEPTLVPIVRIRDILNGTTSAYSKEDADEKYRLSKGDVVVGMDGNFHMNIWSDDTAYLNQRCVRLRHIEGCPISTLQVLHEIAPYIKAKEQNAKGSTVGHLSDKDLKAIWIVKPLTTTKFNPEITFTKLSEKIVENRNEIVALTKQRDELLPLLMNGQVSVMPTEVNCDLDIEAKR